MDLLNFFLIFTKLCILLENKEKKFGLRGTLTVWTARQIFYNNKKLIPTLKNISLTQLKSVREFQHLQSDKL